MADAREKTEKELAKMEAFLKKTYEQAENELTHKWSAYMEAGQKELDSLYNAYIHATGEDRDKALKEYQDAVRNYTLRNEQYKAVVEDTTYHLAKVNDMALSYVNGKVPSIYAINYNEIIPEAVKLGAKFDIVNEGAVKYLSEKIVNYKRDMKWNTKQINSAVLQGILQGESMNKIADRLLPILGNNENSAIRNARTMTTEAENKGKLDRYEDLEEQGIIMKKVWIATPDSRTRESHLELDGEEVDVDEKFSNGLDCPGDMNADDPSEVWNCRCGMRTRIVGRRKANGDIVYLNYEHESGLHDKQIEQEKARREEDNDKEAAKQPNLADVGMKPERPTRASFDDDDEYERAREKYKEERAKWSEQVDEWVKQSVPEPMPMGDFEKWCGKNNVKIYGDISDVDERALQAYTQRMEKLSADFPDVMRYRENLPIPEEFQKYEFGYVNTMDYEAEASHGFTFGSAGRNIEWLLDNQANDVLSGYRVIGDGTLNQLFDHEFGHNVESAILSTFERGADGVLTKEGNEKWNEMERDLLKNVYGKAGMSEYATTNRDELFAEAFSAWYGGEQTEFAKAFGEFLGRWR